jgi:hypothetical protein
MSATQTPRRFVIAAIDREGFLNDELRDGYGLGEGAVGFTPHVFDGAEEAGDAANLAGIAWEKQIVDPAIEEVLPQIRDLLASAIERRLPWTWEPQ